MASDKVTPPSLTRNPEVTDASTGSGQMNLGIYGRFGDSPQSWSAAAASTDTSSDMQAVQASMTETLRKTAEQLQIRQNAEALGKEQENLYQQMRKQQQAYEERQSAMFTKMAALEEIFLKTDRANLSCIVHLIIKYFFVLRWLHLREKTCQNFPRL